MEDLDQQSSRTQISDLWYDIAALILTLLCILAVFGLCAAIYTGEWRFGFLCVPFTFIWWCIA